MSGINYGRLSYLGDRVKAGLATKIEKDEFMKLLRENGSITEQQYSDYISDRNSEALLNAALGIGAVALIGYLLSQLFKEK